MTEPRAFIYEVFMTTLENGQRVMVQIFRDPDSYQVLHSQLAFKTLANDTWGVPYQLEQL
jgi:hypothetical protein